MPIKASKGSVLLALVLQKQRTLLYSELLQVPEIICPLVDGKNNCRNLNTLCCLHLQVSASLALMLHVIICNKRVSRYELTEPPSVCDQARNTQSLLRRKQRNDFQKYTQTQLKQLLILIIIVCSPRLLFLAS